MLDRDTLELVLSRHPRVNKFTIGPTGGSLLDLVCDRRDWIKHVRTVSISQQVGGRDGMRANGDIIHNSDSIQTLSVSTFKAVAGIGDEEMKDTATKDGLLFHILFGSNIHLTNWTPMVLKALVLVIEVPYPLRNWMLAIDFYKLE